MITEAIKSLKERTGSSSKAIGKYIGSTFKVPAGFEKTLSQQLKRLAASGKLVRVKASFKLSDALKVSSRLLCDGNSGFGRQQQSTMLVRAVLLACRRSTTLPTKLCFASLLLLLGCCRSL
jgi:histone H1/5